jgi:predicted extracellular nuclease
MKTSQTSFLKRQRTGLSIVAALLISVIAFAIYFSVLLPPVQGGSFMPSVVVNKYFNAGNAPGDVVELLVTENNLDMRGMILKDFSTSMAGDNGGKLQFTTNALWSSVRSGTLIVLRNDNSAADTTVGGADYNLDLGLQNTTYFISVAGSFDIATTEMVMIKAAGSGDAGVTGSIHVLAGGTAGTQFTNAPNPKLRATGTSGTNQFVFANNSTQSIDDFDGTDATGATMGLTFGAGNNANNTAYINSLRTPGALTISINSPSVLEGNSGTTTLTFTVHLSDLAPAGGVTFDIATQDNSATTADNDYVMRSLKGQTIAENNQNYMFDVTVNGDMTTESTETFFVNVTNVTVATPSSVQGTGTITNDDFASIPIHTVQGSGTSSPFAGQVVTTTGIVTGIKTNGFFIQEPDASVDSNPNTSEGVFVFTSSTPPAAAALGNMVAVMGTVAEFIPNADLNSPPLTEISSSPTVTFLSSGNTLPTPIMLTAMDTSPSGSIEQLEKFEGMRVFVNSLTVSAPTGGNVNEPAATSSSDGVFYGVITGIARPFREPGIEVPDPLPAGSPCCIPRFDGNPERLRVDSNGLVGAPILEVTSGATVTNITGPLDYGFRTYTILPDAATTPSVSGNTIAQPVPTPASDEFTVGTFNMERFFDTVNDPSVGEPVLTTTAFNNRLNKASLAIRNVMKSPDIIGIVEMENLTTLQAVATKINNDTVAGGDPNPNYQAYLEEGNDPGGIDVGFLVKASRVTALSVTQVGKTATYIDPNNGMPDLLNDRPPLVLVASINAPCGGTFPLTVIVNHLRSLNSVDDPVDGNRVRTKRRAQAEFLANLIQARQTADMNEKIISIGDYNAFQFNDGYGDSMGTIRGTPTKSNQVVLASPDLVNPNLIELLEEAPADQRYSFSFDGNAQVLDHELVTQNLFRHFSRVSYARNNADFPESFRNDPNRSERLADHDMPVAYFTFTAISPLSASFQSSGGSGTVSVFAPTGCNWTATSNAPWIFVTSENSSSGNQKVFYEVKTNLTNSTRTGTVTIAGRTFTISQVGAYIDCAYSISPQSQSFSLSGGMGTINVSATAGCSWSASSNVSWINIVSGNSGTGNGVVTYSVSGHNSGTRTGTLTVAGQTFTVKQKGR